MCGSGHTHSSGLLRREFLQSVGLGATILSMSGVAPSVLAEAFSKTGKRKPKYLGAFLYTPTSELKKEGYYSWPGSSFDPEGMEKEYRQQFADLSEIMGFELEWEPGPIGRTEQFQQLANRIETAKPDGVLLAAFKKTVWQSHGKDLLEAISPPSVVLAPLGVLLIPSVYELEAEPGVCMISSSNPLDDVEMPLRMLGANVLMAESVILNLQGDNREEEIRVPGLNTRVRTVPRQTYIDVYQAMRDTEEVRDLARDYLGRAVEVVEPNEADVLDAAKSYFALKKVLESENADALMMDCLPGLKFPHQHVPPCMGFMSLRDEGIVAGCES
ncbi:MAG: hypothetical protein KC940_06560, partial [Candidatus Omnitrophica bacterium]|nr:hypothetical protein [Candidatus Omnitrophota bacterium]